MLPDDARFCHKCGKPQLEEDIARLSTFDKATAPVQGPLDVPGSAANDKTAPIGFNNFRALTITVGVAAVAIIPLALAMIILPLGLVVLCAAGYFAAHFYRKQTMQPLSAGGGAYLGVMTGVWLFLVFAFCVFVVNSELNTEAGRELLKTSLARVPEAAKMLADPQQFLAGLRQALVEMFFLTTISAALGGLLAARRAARKTQP